MNVCVFIGRIGKDPEMKFSQNGKAVTHFSLGITRDYDREHTDWIRCVAFGKTAEIIDTYCKKGDALGVLGRMQTGSYEDRDGKTVYTTDCIVERVELMGGGKKSSQKPNNDDTEGSTEPNFSQIEQDIPF